MSELAQREDHELARVQPTPMELIQHAIDKGIDPEKLTVLVDLKERMDRNDAAAAYAEALQTFQEKCPMVEKRRDADFNGKHAYSFASYDDVMRVIKPILAECGLSVSFSMVMQGELIVCTCSVKHGIHSEPHTLPVPIPKGMKVNDTQQAGAAFAYAKRYTLCNALNITVTDEDTDAHAAPDPVTPEQAARIQDMIQEAEVDEARFLKWAEVERVEDMNQRNYEPAMEFLRRKLAARLGK